MGDSNHLIGVTISSKDASLRERLEEAKRMRLGWIQVYIEPGTTNEHIEPFNDSGLEIAVHAAHEDHGLVFSRGDDELNRRLFDEAVQSAEYLRSRLIIIHPGYFTPAELNSGCEEMLKIDERFERLTRYISRLTKGGFRVLVENLLRWDNGMQTVFHNPHSPFYDDMNRAGFGFCLDLANVAVNFNCFPDLVYDQPTTDVAFRCDSDRQIAFGETLDALAQMRLYEIRKAHERHVIDFLRLKPEAMHLRGLHYWHVKRPKARQPVPMSDLNAVQLRIIIPYCLRRNVPLLLESLDPQQQKADVLFINQQYQSLTG